MNDRENRKKYVNRPRIDSTMEMLTEMPEFEDKTHTSIQEHLLMLENLINDQEAGLAMIKRHLILLKQKLD